MKTPAGQADGGNASEIDGIKVGQEVKPQNPLDGSCEVGSPVSGHSTRRRNPAEA